MASLLFYALVALAFGMIIGVVGDALGVPLWGQLPVSAICGWYTQDIIRFVKAKLL